jgi:hypothetical protein
MTFSSLGLEGVWNLSIAPDMQLVVRSYHLLLLSDPSDIDHVPQIAPCVTAVAAGLSRRSWGAD